jgi:hypothetical protein
MSKGRALLAAFGLSAITGPLIFVAFLAAAGGTSRLLALSFVIAVAVAVLHLLIVGLPAFMLLRRKSWVGWWQVSAAGFVCGFLPMAVVQLPWLKAAGAYSESAYWHGRYVVLFANGVATLYGWLSYIESCASVGLFGIVTALVFWWSLVAFESKRPAKDAAA